MHGKISFDLDKAERHRASHGPTQKKHGKSKTNKKQYDQFKAVEQYAAILMRNDDHHIAKKRADFEEEALRQEMLLDKDETDQSTPRS